MTRAVYVKLWSMTHLYRDRRSYGWRDVLPNWGLFLITPGIAVVWVAWPLIPFEWKKYFTGGLWVDPYRVRRYEGQEGFPPRH